MKYKYLKGSEKDFDGAPEWAMVAVKHYTSSSCDFASSPHDGSRVFYPLEKTEVTILDIDDWELIAERQPITESSWDGVGLPPVGARVSFFRDESYTYNLMQIPDDGKELEVIAHKVTSDENDVAVCYWDEGGAGRAVCLVGDCLRPIRSEADKKRDAAIATIDGYMLVNTNPSKLSTELYDLIAAGKIPGVKLGD